MMDKGRGVKLYNVIFPPWMLLILPITWLVVLPANFLIDSAVLLIACAAMKMADKKTIYKRSILWIWGFGFVADIVGAAVLFVLLITVGSMEGDWIYQHIGKPLSANPFTSPIGFAIVFLAIALAGALIYVLNLKISFRKLDIDPREKRKLALALAVFTAPYLYLLPTEWMYSGY